MDGALTDLARDRGRPDSHRIRAVRLLAGAESEEALEVLRGMTWTRHWFFWRRLASVDRIMLEAVSSLTRGWSDHPRARPVLAAAREAGDERVRQAVAAGERPPPDPDDEGTDDRVDGEEAA